VLHGSTIFLTLQVDVGEKHPSHVLVGPDGDLVAIAGNPDPVVTLLRVSQGLRVVQKLRRDTPAGENFQGYEDVAFSPDGQLLAAACAGVRPIQVGFCVSWLSEVRHMHILHAFNDICDAGQAYPGRSYSGRQPHMSSLPAAHCVVFLVHHQ
jgi:hypothetical protein